jgi:hypothetical protein
VFEGGGENSDPIKKNLCDSDIYAKYLVFQYAIASIPYLIYFMAGMYRYFDIRSIGIARVQAYSFSFKIKVGLSFASSIVYLMAFIILLAVNGDLQASWSEYCN